MRRRHFIAGLASAAAARRAWAQAAPGPAHIAFVHSGIPAAQLTAASKTPWVRVFFESLRRLGYVEGKNLVVERYSAEGRTERFAELARAVVAQKPDAIVANGPLVGRLKAATGTIPIVAIMGDPVRFGLVASLARPGGNVTGVSVDAGIEVYGKDLQILKEAIPSAAKIAYLGSPGLLGGVAGQGLQDGGRRLGVSVVLMPLEEATPARFREVFAEMARQRVDGLMVSPEGEYLAQYRLIVDLAKEGRLPGIYPYRDFVEAGGLMAYAPDLADLANRMAGQVRDILGGADPGQIPVYQATTFTLIVNLKTAKALGLTVPPILLAQADEVIQ
ncbi:MAG TPA: ABC transporter substrate-binding protein [Stellaceae bacterium]|nr:ABC transporter substrate-binding protein [Stellaceae bacterium]